MVHEPMRAEAHRLRRLAHMREHHHVVGAISTCAIHCPLEELVERVGFQVIEQDAVGVVERVALENHRLRCTSADVCHPLVAILVNDVRGIERPGLARLEEVGAHDGRPYHSEQLLHAGHAVVELMVAQCQRMIVHQAHNVGNVLSLRDGTRGVALQEVATADDSGKGRVRAVDGIA